MRNSLVPLSLLFACAPAWADSAQLQIESYLSQRIEAAVTGQFPALQNLQINFRIASAVKNLPACEQPLFSDKAMGSYLGSETWWVECGNNWRIKAVTNVSVDTKVVSTKGPLRKGHRIEANDVKLDVETLSLKGTVYQHIEDVVGTKLRRSAKANQVLTRRYVELEYAATKGHHVIISFHSESFSLETQGVALEDGMVGDRIRVMNSESGRELSVTVTGENRVEQN
ncbi:flagellar basal body P-ring formation chaperone FlgA [Vibrio diazotrophicus]|uniref:flagellar basal body P-ring formation chaperone FlgA n=1 Tax=Vibrio diazotrophicus TaxID=685 RepID=UPI000C9DF4FE|nr:flagellar basal body P-ring formation chaperone FlgA [Vibrio diazotrophicus]PNH97975.1 flagella basal body P-ring formation protein FlgA [Vibrio diazotrophicus]